MQRDMQVEVILCPNCDEDVPKTLYCLNCGYPLYKVEAEQERPEMDEAETAVVEETIETELIIEQDTEPEVFAVVEEVVEAPSELIIEEVETEEIPEIVSVEEPEETVELVEVVEAQDEPVVEAIEVQEPEVVQEDYEVSEVEVIATEEAPLEIMEEASSEIIEEAAVEVIEDSIEAEEVEIIEEAAVEVIEESIEAEEVEIIEEAAVEVIEESIEAEEVEIIEEAAVEVIEESIEDEEAEIVQEVEEEPSLEFEEAAVVFEPDPLTTMVMENLLKSISLKVRLVNLLRESDVKEATFNRLFESYAAKGERWTNQRNEMLERCRYNLDAMEKKLSEAKTGLEELEIRKAIDDATEEEYLAKAPAFEWDIHLLEGELQRRKGEIAYIEDLTRVMPAEEIQMLTDMADNCYNAFDGLVEEERISSETAERVKSALQEALDCLKGEGC